MHPLLSKLESAADLHGFTNAQLTELAADAQAGGDEKGKKDAGKRRRATRGGKAAESGRAAKGAKSAEKPARKRAAG